MKSLSTAQRIATVLAALAVFATASGVAQATTSRPAGISKAEYRTLLIRGEALNRRYRVGDWKGVPQGMTPAQYRSLEIRSQALDKKYGHARATGASAARTPTDSAQPFAWGAFGIGAAAMLGLVLLGVGIVGGRLRRHGPRVRTS